MLDRLPDGEMRRFFENTSLLTDPEALERSIRPI